jgi:hypothetical protein
MGMRVLILTGLFLVGFLYFRKSETTPIQDSLSSQVSAIKRIRPTLVTSKAIIEPEAKVSFVDEASPIIEEDEVIDQSQDSFEDQESALPIADLEEGWSRELKDFLSSVDPEKAEELHAAYYEERKKYADRGGEAFATSEDPELDEDIGPRFVETDDKMDQLEKGHQDNLKHIFGEHYEAVQNLHKEYIQSLQHLGSGAISL